MTTRDRSISLSHLSLFLPFSFLRSLFFSTRNRKKEKRTSKEVKEDINWKHKTLFVLECVFLKILLLLILIPESFLHHVEKKRSPICMANSTMAVTNAPVFICICDTPKYIQLNRSGRESIENELCVNSATTVLGSSIISARLGHSKGGGWPLSPLRAAGLYLIRKVVLLQEEVYLFGSK